MNEFTEALSTIEGTVLRDGNVYQVRAVQSSGGAAGGVVSEGQGYGLFIAGATAAALPSSHPKRLETVRLAHEYFEGWRRMCERTSGNSCQTPPNMCGGGSHECLPSWKFDSRLTAEQGTGSAPDGDEDAILGMILLLLTTQGDPPSWWSDLAQWTYDSCRSFLAHVTQVQSGSSLRVLKLGSCWGGWDCVNPSYMAPGHYRVFREYTTQYSAKIGNAAEGAALARQWNELIDTSYIILNEAQCETTGLITNWWIPSQSTAQNSGTPGCSGSGTPAAEFGSEASRTAWRIALDAIWYGNPDAIEWCRRLAHHVTSKLSVCDSPWSCSVQLDTGCAIDSIHSGWLDNAFMFGPMMTSLLIPTSENDAQDQQAALDWTVNHLSTKTITDYYSGSWVAIATLTITDGLMLATTVNRMNLTRAEETQQYFPSQSTLQSPPPSQIIPTATLPPAPAPADEHCSIAMWSCCGGSSCTAVGCCADGGACVAKNQWYHQCRNECPMQPESDGTFWDCALRRVRRAQQEAASLQQLSDSLHRTLLDMAGE